MFLAVAKGSQLVQNHTVVVFCRYPVGGVLLNMFIGFLLYPVSIVMFPNISTGLLGYEVCVRSLAAMLNEFLW